jgi:hypothetical protein
MKKLLYLLIILLTGCSANKNLYKVGNLIWYEGISPDYDNEIFHLYKLEQKVADIPFDSIKYICEKRYSGIKKEDGSFDTLKINQGPFESYLNDSGYVYLYKRTPGDGSLTYEDSLFYEYYPNKLLKTVTVRTTNRPNSGNTWNIKYNRNRLIKKHTLYKRNGRLIVEKLFDYHPFANEIIATIRYGKENILNKTQYKYDKNGRILSTTTYQYLTKTIGNTTYEYESDGNYVVKFQLLDSTKTLREGYDKFSNNKLIESFMEDYRDKYRINKSLDTSKYYEDGRLKEEIHKSSSIPTEKDKGKIYPEWDDSNTSKTLYFYKTDYNKKEVWNIRYYKNNLNSGNVSIDVLIYK